jgi:DNA-directed RNA polymerase subunit H (RpoH/RPB5)
MKPSPECPVQMHLGSYESFVQRFTEDPDRTLLNMIFERPDGTNFVVLFATQSDESRIGKQDILAYVERFRDLGAAGGILIVESSRTPSKRPITSMAIDVLQAEDIPIEVFEDTQLVYNVLLHEFQPHFEIVDPSKYAEITSTFCTLQQLPRMKTNDIVCRLIGAKRGNVVKVTNVVETSGVAVQYLFVQ